jgi:DNA-binding transcriptional MerR regulator
MTNSAANARPPRAAPAAQATDAGTRAATRADGGVLRIGDVAARAGVSVDALRYYERRGLLQPTGRRASGYREYPPDAAQLVRFIKRAQALGFTLAEVEELVRLRGDARRPDAALAARDVAQAKIRDIDERVRQLTALRGALAQLVESCEATCGSACAPPDAHCAIIGALDGADDAST